MSTTANTPTTTNFEDFVKLGDIKDSIAPLGIDAAGLSQLGFDPAITVKASKLYLKSDLPQILTAIATHAYVAASKYAKG